MNDDTTEEIVWPEEDMVAATLEFWGDDSIEADDCVVRESTDDDDEPCLIVLHRPTGRTSAEAGDAGRWHLDGTACHQGS